jgi:predicted site-specific integrase-resolvase
MDIANRKPETWPKAATLQKWSRILDVSYSTIHKYHKLGAFEGKRQVDRSIIVPKKDIIKWLEMEAS